MAPYVSIGESAEELRQDRAYFCGTLLGVLAYGALLMLYIQFVQVLSVRPKRGRTFWMILVYSGILFALATIAVGVLFKRGALLYVDAGDSSDSEGFSGFLRGFSSNSIGALGDASNTIFPWFADILMILRLLTIWNYNLWVVAFPILMYLSKMAISIPLLISQIKPHSPEWVSRSIAFGTCYHSLTLAFNIYVTFAICFQICSMRKQLETVSGKVHALYYTSRTTKFLESGGFFTIWTTVYLILRVRGSSAQQTFLIPYIYTLGITRMFIILRIAQDRAWTKDLVVATHRGALEWQVSSTHSVPLHDISSNQDSTASFNNKILHPKSAGNSITLTPL